ncbi:MAG: hypothetical protein ACU843_05505 [Gammaproteobacteria bacterium]
MCSRMEGTSRTCRSILKVLLWASLLGPVRILAGTENSVDFLYIEAGQGDSSGGHAAIGFANDVFHYQYVQGLLKATRQDRNEFEYQYRFLQNRSIHISRIAVDQSAYQVLFDYFAHKHRVQSRQFEALDLIRKDLDFLETLVDSASSQHPGKGFRYSIRGGALFAAANRSESFAPRESVEGFSVLLKRIARAYGHDFLSDRKAHLTEKLAGLQETDWSPEELRISADHYPLLPYSAADRFADMLANLSALEVVQSRGALTREALISSDLPELRLQAPEIRLLRRFRKQLQDDLLKLIASSRPDWGYPLLLGLARLKALDDSVRNEKFVFLNTFRADPEWVDLEDIRRYRETFNLLLQEAQHDFRREKSKFLALRKFDEAGFSLLEHSGNRYIELAQGLAAGAPMRIHSGDLAPIASGEVSVPLLPRMSRVHLARARAHLRHQEQHVSQQLETLYRYDLLTRNCVSELFEDIQKALLLPSQIADPAEAMRMKSARVLGQDIENTHWNPVPFIAAAQVYNHLPLRDSPTLLSFRQKRLEGLYRAGTPFIAYLRETNTLTSTLYPWNPDDGLFLFFTDDQVATRPLFGAFNLVAGIGQILVGGLIAPLTSSDFFFAGLRGFFSSLPELAFFNIRKGSYRYQPFEHLMKPEGPD